MVWAALTGGLIGAGSSLLGDYLANQRQKEQNAWQEQQDLKNRLFQSREAQLARDWQENFYNEYQSPDAMVEQYQKAGINPALMFGSSHPGSPPSTSTPQGGVTTPTNVSSRAMDVAGDIANSVNIGSSIRQNIEKAKILKNERIVSDIDSKLAKLQGKAMDSLESRIVNTIVQKLNNDEKEELNRQLGLESERLTKENEKLVNGAQSMALQIMSEYPLDKIDEQFVKDLESNYIENGVTNTVAYDSALVWKFIQDYKKENSEFNQTKAEEFFANRRVQIAKDSGIDVQGNSTLELQQKLQELFSKTDDDGTSVFQKLIYLSFVPGLPGAAASVVDTVGDGIFELLDIFGAVGKAIKNLFQGFVKTGGSSSD